jgi:hypothetical protein
MNIFKSKVLFHGTHILYTNGKFQAHFFIHNENIFKLKNLTSMQACYVFSHD